MYLDTPPNGEIVRRSSTVTVQAQRMQNNITLMHFYDIQGNSPASLAFTDDELLKMAAMIQAVRTNKELGEVIMMPCDPNNPNKNEVA